MLHNPPTLTPRLAAVAGFIPKCDCFADIGTDHAYLPVYLCMKNICKYAIASDINKGPLKRAKNTVSGYGMSDRISLRLGGGFETLKPFEAKAAAVAGMGGIIIAKILEDGKKKFTKDSRIVLQPMTGVQELREYLCRGGWDIECESLAKEDEKIYNIIVVRRSDDTKISMTDAELFLGKYLIEHKPEHFEEYLEKKKTKLIKMIAGLGASKTAESYEKSEQCIKLLNEIENL